jgi:signal transduction histidine kinase
MTIPASTAAHEDEAPGSFQPARVYVPLVLCLLVTSAVTYLLYVTTQNLFRRSIDERLLELAPVAALQFDPRELDEIVGRESVESDLYREIVHRLQDIRQETRRVRYAYILRQSDDSTTFEFVADADSLDPNVPVDLNGDGRIDESDALVFPGDPYDVSSFPEFRASAFRAPFVDPELTHDQWGTFLSGTAPIRDIPRSAQPARYVLGLDLDVSEFEAQMNRALRPFVGFVLFLLLVIAALTIGLAAIWRRQIERLAEVDRQKDELIGIVSHQLNGPITAIHWQLEEVLDGELGALTAKQRQHALRVRQAASNLADLTSLLLDVSRIELGRLPMDRRETKLDELFAAVVEPARDLAREKGVELRIELPSTLPMAVLDARLTRMALDNLLSNAIKYTPAGGKVTLAATVRDDTLLCDVADTGVGIPEVDQPRIFGKLYRASNVRNLAGHGFGLYVAKGAIEQQGGSLSFASVEGRGTTFTMRIPLSKPARATQDEQARRFLRETISN